MSLPPSFKLTLKIDASGYQVVSNLEHIAGGNLSLSGHQVDDSALSMGSLSIPAQQTLTQFRNLFKNQTVDLNTMVQQATALTRHGVGVAVSLDLYLDKNKLIRSLENAAQDEITANIVAYLFQDQLTRKLRNTTIDTFETEFLGFGKPTVFLVFDTTGRLASEFITVCGQDQGDVVEAELCRPLTQKTLDGWVQIRQFRQSQSFGNFAPRWLMPEFFALASPPGAPNIDAALQCELQRFQPAVAAIFMADLVETANGIYSVEFRGLRHKRFQLDDAQLRTQQPHWSSVYDLYRYAYDGVSGDKLEIVQQFISQFADDAASLCANAAEIREAARPTYNRTLTVKVQEYFAARQSVQERIQTAVAGLANDVITLSRDVSADVYKVLGIIALAVAGSFFKADIGVVALMLGFLTIALYSLIVVLYYLPTLNRATELRKSQHVAYINSFSDTLTEDEIGRFLADDIWRRANTTFENKLWLTKAIYWTLCVISFLAGVGMVISIWRSSPAIPPVNIAVVAGEILLSF